MSIDAITLALLSESLRSFVREMRTVIIRTSFSPMMHEGHDFSCAIMTPHGELVAASEVDQPTHICSLPWLTRAVLARYDNIVEEDDLFLSNDPYAGGTHLNDVILVRPVFVDGQLLALAGVMAHWQDVGGMVPGSLAGTATEIFQEGIRIPPTRIAHRGVVLQEVIDILLANVREPEDRDGDLRAMKGACLLAQAKLQALAARWSFRTLTAAMEGLLDSAEQRMRAALSAMPAGTYQSEVHLDNTGSSPEPLSLRLSLCIAGNQLVADFTGCPTPIAGPTNLGPAQASTAVFTMTKAFLDPQGPINAGAMRPLQVIVPEATMLNAKPPAACGAIGEVRRALESLVMGALGRALPEKAVGDLKGASNITTIAWPGRPPFVEFPAGGTGAWFASDGNNALRNFAEGDLSSIHPAEAIELRWPLRVECCSLRQDSGGPGKRRGGLGLDRWLRVLLPGATLSLLSDKNVIPPYGVNGGYGGLPNQFVVRRGCAEIAPSPLPGKVTAFPLQEGDIVIMRTAGGGGYGDVRERNCELVERDVAFGYVSKRAAHLIYGVQRGPRKTVAPGLAFLRAIKIVANAGRRRAVLASTTAHVLCLSHDDLIEFPIPGPSIRAWIFVNDDIEENCIGLDSDTHRLIAAKPRQPVSFRRVATL